MSASAFERKVQEEWRRQQDRMELNRRIARMPRIQEVIQTLLSVPTKELEAQALSLGISNIVLAQHANKRYGLIFEIAQAQALQAEAQTRQSSEDDALGS